MRAVVAFCHDTHSVSLRAHFNLVAVMAATRKTCTFVYSVVTLTLCSQVMRGASQVQSLRGTVNRTISAEELETRLGSLLQVLRTEDDDRGFVQRCSRIEASMARTFQALPKNGLGRLAPRSVRHIVHTYFAKQHGWLINGLEPHGMQTSMTQVHDVGVLKQKAPAFLEAMLEERRLDHGLSIQDVAALAALLESLILEESADLLEDAYDLNNSTIDEPLTEEVLHRVLRTYLYLFRLGEDALMDPVDLELTLLTTGDAKTPWPSSADLEQDTVLNSRFAQRHATNPFREPLYSFESATSLMNSIAEQYGRWQNMECGLMKEELMAFDRHGSGHVPLGLFYGHSSQFGYRFMEGKEYLRDIGVLDESHPNYPRVRIANYVLGPSNCIASSAYFSICCLNECNVLMDELEGTIQAPTASVERLLPLVSNLSSSTIDAPRKLTADLVHKLQSVAAANGGEVPLHGRLFAQWLHHTFPHECPYPHIVQDAAVLKPSHWHPDRLASSAEEQAAQVGAAAAEAAELRVQAQWSNVEVLPLQAAEGWALMSGLTRVAVLSAMGLVVFQAATSAFTTSSRAIGPHDAKGKGSGLLPS